jgi:hypothetical protein
MTRQQITFLMTGLIMGLVCVLPGKSLLMLLTLTWGVGPAFFAAVVAGIIITGARRHLQAGFLRYIAGLVVCFVTYMLALTVFFAVGGFSPGWFGFRPSDSFEQFSMDIFLGLLAAATFAASGIALFAFVLTGRWSNSLLARLLLAGIVTIRVYVHSQLPIPQLLVVLWRVNPAGYVTLLRGGRSAHLATLRIGKTNCSNRGRATSSTGMMRDEGFNDSGEPLLL